MKTASPERVQSMLSHNSVIALPTANDPRGAETKPAPRPQLVEGLQPAESPSRAWPDPTRVRRPAPRHDAAARRRRRLAWPWRG
jgi:hypothetical protein